MFELYNTDSIHIKNVCSVSVKENEVGNRRYCFGETDFYQLGIKFKGKTKISYNKEYLDYFDETVLFLPCEKLKNIPYNKVFLEHGYGICIFFTSGHALPDKPKIYSAKHKEIKQSFHNILTAFKNDKMLEAKSTFFHILSLLDETETNKDANLSYAPVLEYINTNIANTHIDINHLADLCDVSADYFRHDFHKHFGMSPKKYISKLKVDLIKEMLMNDSENISTIANKTGYYDNNYFTRFFKKETGYTPSQYRKKHKTLL